MYVANEENPGKLVELTTMREEEAEFLVVQPFFLGNIFAVTEFSVKPG